MKQTPGGGGRGYNVPVFSMEQIRRVTLSQGKPPGSHHAGFPDLVGPAASEFDSIPSNPTFDEMYVRRVRRARATPSIDKLRESLQSFEPVAERMRAGVRIRKPAANGPECLATVRAQLATLRRLEDRPVYMLIAGDGS